MTHIFRKFIEFILLFLLISFMAVDFYAKKNHIKITINPNFIDDLVEIVE